MFKNKKFIIILGIIVFIIILVFLFFMFKKGQTDRTIIKTDKITANKIINKIVSPKFLTNFEKKNLGLNPELKVQVLNRDKSGRVAVYKIINRDSDIIAHPDKLKAISPSQEKTSE